MPTDSTESVFVGVDTYADTHHVAVVDSVGRHLGDREFPTSRGFG
jgi:transposase